MAFPEAWMAELLSKNDIVSVVSDYIELKPRGSSLWGHCPFHTDKTPSFSVTPDKQLFHCFSCKAGGSVIQFIMQVENLSFPDAVRHLASRVNMDMPDEIDDRRLMELKLLRERIYEANRETGVYYYKCLLSEEGRTARQYLDKRGVSPEMAKKFGLGYSPDGFDTLYKYLIGKGFSREILLKAGLVSMGRKDPEKSYDFFRDRLMFPIISAAGKVLGFGGRTMKDEEPKYKNTGDTPVYNKRENIYAINMLKGKKLDDIIMVEGYMDVISLHQAGIDNAVASLGTALTGQQARLLKRYAPTVYYAYDGDEAGQKAMTRGIDILRSCEIDPRVIVIPGGKDPDEFVKAYGRDSFLMLKDASITGIRFKLDRIARQHGTSTPDGRQRFAIEACSLISKLEPVERDRYIPYVSELSSLPAETVREQCGIEAKRESENPQQPRPLGYRRPKKDTDRQALERKLLSCIMSSAKNGLEISRLKGFSLTLFSDAPIREFAAKLISAYSDGGKEADISLMLAELEPSSAEGISSAYSAAGSVPSPVASAKDLVSRIKEDELTKELKDLSDLAEKGETAEERLTALNEYKRKYNMLLELKKKRSF